MSDFIPATITLSGKLPVAAAIGDAFPLFSPAGEKLWIASWDPEYLYPPGAEWEQGQIFRTQEESGEAVWLVNHLDRAAHSAEYHRVEPGRYVARVTVGCEAVGRDRTEVSIAYTFIGLSEQGNRDITAMSQQDYDAKLVKWTEWIVNYLATT